MIIPFVHNLCNFKRPKNRIFGPKCQDLFCRKGLPGFWRGRCRIATAALLHDDNPREALTAKPEHFRHASNIAQPF